VSLLLVGFVLGVVFSVGFAAWLDRVETELEEFGKERRRYLGAGRGEERRD